MKFFCLTLNLENIESGKVEKYLVEIIDYLNR